MLDGKQKKKNVKENTVKKLTVITTVSLHELFQVGTGRTVKELLRNLNGLSTINNHVKK